jgi:hypothetical protein
MNSTTEGLFKDDIEGEMLNQKYRTNYCSYHPDLRKCAKIFNKIVNHVQENTLLSVSQIINRFMIENSDLSNLKRYTLVIFLDLDNYIRYKRRL